MEGPDRELKSEYRATEREKLELVKSIVSMANTEGGDLRFRSLKCDASLLDSARLDDLVNKYVQPPFHGIASGMTDDGRCDIVIQKSTRRPHLFVATANYKDDKTGKQRPAFHAGQVFVRHSSKTEPADGEDIDRILREATAEVVSQLGRAIQNVSGQLSEQGIPVTLGSEGLFTVSMMDPNKSFPYTTKALGQEIGKGQNWVAQAVRKLGLWPKPEYCWMVEGGGGLALFPKYNDAALNALRQKLKEDPNFNPYS